MEQKLLELLTQEIPSVDFKSKSLVDDGILDSVLITEIVAHISMEFGIQIPYEEITEQNFNSVASMAAMVERLSR